MKVTKKVTGESIDLFRDDTKIEYFVTVFDKEDARRTANALGQRAAAMLMRNKGHRKNDITNEFLKINTENADKVMSEEETILGDLLDGVFDDESPKTYPVEDPVVGHIYAEIERQSQIDFKETA
jgi:hypothetical protein